MKTITKQQLKQDLINDIKSNLSELRKENKSLLNKLSELETAESSTFTQIISQINLNNIKINKELGKFKIIKDLESFNLLELN